ncbi:GSK3-beta interaction protein [Geodia barretti]|uniref:GSK3-beta interaction protein n=1 Tax=Geodia barretti TaxID=519541 RepID=A0AA35TE71_GEOBA|nr:GSK3-beta interaction protein [Geodia barretti]
MEFEVLEFKKEAQQSLDEVRYALSEGWVSERLESSSQYAYLNLTTREGQEYCVRLSGRGFQVVGRSHDEVSGEEGGTWETVYSLLNCISPSYSSSFSARLADRLNRLQPSAERPEQND